MKSRWWLLTGPIVLCLCPARPAYAADATLSPGVTQAEVASKIDALGPGDTLTISAGDYSGIDLDLQHSDGSGLAGTETAPISIVGTKDASGNPPHITADTDSYQEGLRLRSGSAYVTIQGLHLSAKGSQTQAGILIDSGVDHVTITDNLIEDVTGIGIQIQTQSDVHDLLIEHNEIHHTGTNTSDGNNGGQAFTAGGFSAGSATSNVHHLVLRGNLIHDNMGQEGDCLKFMYGVYASTMEDNVLYNCPRGVAQAENYGITSYGSGVGHYQTAADDNIVRRNLVYASAGLSSGETNVGIYVGPGTRVENNLVIQSNQGIAARLEDEASEMRNLTVVNNTVYDATDYAFSIRGCQQADSSVVVSGNVFIAVQAAGFGYRMPDPIGNMVATANWYDGQDYAEASPPVMNKLANPPSALFVSPSSTIPGADFMLAAGSALIDQADPQTAPADDFDLATRPVGAGPDVGAYESRTDLSDHWALGLGFKGTTGSGGIPGSGGSSGSSATGGGGNPSGGSSAGGNPSGGSSAGGANAKPGAGEDSGGCGCALPARSGSTDLGVLALVLAGFGVRRARRARRSLAQ